MRDPKPTPQNTKEPSGSDFVRKIELNAGGIDDIELGRFKERDKKPRFEIECEPESAAHNIMYGDKKLSNGTIYILTRTFQNLGDTPCAVTIRHSRS